jgi:MFS family permease
MLPVNLIYGCIILGLIVTAIIIATDGKQYTALQSIIFGKDELSRFQRVYLPVFLSAMLADWLQGPFVYALYQGYGIDREHNGYLFVAGFGASALFGTFVGSLADQCGRKKFALLYCIVYFGHCLTKHMNSFAVLTLGRIMGGISTSLLFSVFDSWLVSESTRRGFEGGQLGDTFSVAFFGSSIAAIAAGQLGEIAAKVQPLTELGGNVYFGGYITPFDLANCFLVLCMFLITKSWSENYGQSTLAGGTNFADAAKVIMEKKDVLLCGLIASSFESSMFIFVFNWTPCLMVDGEDPPPFGHIFSCFMIMCMLGSRIFSYLQTVMKTEMIVLITIGVAACSHMVVVLSADVTIRFFAFLAFEACVGMYFPSIGSLKGDIVPEDFRATIYNIYRLPLNVIVLLPLLLNFSITTTFIVTSTILIIASVCTWLLAQYRGENPKKDKAPEPKDMENIVGGEQPVEEDM